MVVAAKRLVVLVLEELAYLLRDQLLVDSPGLLQYFFDSVVLQFLMAVSAFQVSDVGRLSDL